MSFANDSLLAVVVAMAGLALISVVAVSVSIQEGDVGSACGWAVVFLGATFLAAWCFWRLV
jgi:hypothetical protein